jgi:hypothetical protein
LKGSRELWRLRVSCSISDAEKVADIIAVRHWREAYD